MLQRCNNPNNPNYSRYGGRGISVCERWHFFDAFLADAGERPSPELSLHRIDNDGNYEPGNVCWATLREQASNKRQRTKKAKEQQRRYLSNPGYLSVEEAAEQKGVSRGAVVKRINQGELPVMMVNQVMIVREKDVNGWVIDESRRERGSLGGRPRNHLEKRN